MSTDTDGRPAASLHSRLIGRQRPLPVTVAISLLLVLAPLAAAYLDGLVDELLRHGHWRILLSPAAVIIYILAVAPVLERFDARVIGALRPLVLIDSESFDRLVARASRISPTGEGLACCLGAVFGLLLGQSWFTDSDAFWLRLVVTLSSVVMYGLLAWTIYVSVAATRLIAELHEQPLRIDIFDTKPFRPVGRQSLIIALVFVGGIALAMVFTLDVNSILDWRNWIVYSLLALVPVVVFFLNMRPTHRVLSTEKKRELAAVERRFLSACRTLLSRIDEGETHPREGRERRESSGMHAGMRAGTGGTLAGPGTGTLAGPGTGTLAGPGTGTLAGKSAGTLAGEINALVAYEERLKAASTWPYDTAMLRTLFVSVGIPAAAALARVIGESVLE